MTGLNNNILIPFLSLYSLLIDNVKHNKRATSAALLLDA